MVKRHQYRRAYCTALCPRRRNSETDCTLCRSLDEADRFWSWLSLVKIQRRQRPAILWPKLRLWPAKVYGDLTGPNGHRVAIPLLVTIIGSYFGLYAIMEARHERRQNRAAFEQAVFTDLVTSNNRISFAAAMERFRYIQIMEVPQEPHLWPLWNILNWWGKPKQPNMLPLLIWASNFFPTCTPQLCNFIGNRETISQYKGFQEPVLSDNIDELYKGFKKQYRIVLRSIDLRNTNLNSTYLRDTDFRDSNLNGVILSSADLRRTNFCLANLRYSDLSFADLRGGTLCFTDLRGADLTYANLRGANLSGAYLSGPDLFGVVFPDAVLTGIKYDSSTIWPEGFTPPPSR